MEGTERRTGVFSSCAALDTVAGGSIDVRVRGIEALVGEDAVTAPTADIEVVDVGPGIVELVAARLDDVWLDDGVAVAGIKAVLDEGRDGDKVELGGGIL